MKKACVYRGKEKKERCFLPILHVHIIIWIARVIYMKILLPSVRLYFWWYTFCNRINNLYFLNEIMFTLAQKTLGIKLRQGKQNRLKMKEIKNTNNIGSAQPFAI